MTNEEGREETPMNKRCQCGKYQRCSICKETKPCPSCEEYKRLRQHFDGEGLGVYIHEGCTPVPIFILSGPVPQTPTEAERVIGKLKRAFGLLNTPGPKPTQITYEDIENAYAEIPGAGLVRLAVEMGVSKRKIQKALKERGETFISFKTAFFNRRCRDNSTLSVRFKRPRFK
jgi:hypothetical protein